MALVTKNDVTQIFAIQAPSIDLPPTFANYPRGWDTARSNNGKPTIKQFNYIQQRTDQNVLWIHQNGAALPYDATMEYAENAHVVKDGELQKKQGASWVSATNKGYNLDYFVSGKSYPLHAEIMLENGDIVKSTVANNTTDPNVDMTGWVNLNLASLIKFSDGSNVQQFYDVSKLKDYAFVTPEMHGAKANDPAFDNTAALNAAFATGTDVYSTPDKTYYVTGSLRTKGQRTIGGWKIHSKKQTSRKGVWEKEVTVNNDGLDNSNNIRMMYVSSSWDLSEFLAIKALGFNTIHHYVGMSDMGWDWDGDVFDVLNNAKTAGLKVSLGIEQDPDAVADLASWVASVDNYPALWAYSVIDEPMSRGFTVADQDAKIAQMRALTKKTLFTVDWMNNAFEQKYSKNYDMVLVNSYSMKYTTDASTWFQEDLKKFRGDFGVIKSQVGTNVRVIPCVSMFSFSNTANFFSADVDQIVKSSEYFAKVSNGDYASFVWDGEADAQITGSVRDTAKFQELSVRLSKQPRLQFKTDVIKFGGVSTVSTDWGINEIIEHVIRKDPDSADAFIFAGAYPIVLRNGASETDRTSPAITAGTTISGIGFKSVDGMILTDITFAKNLRLHLEAFSPTAVLNGNFSVISSNDGGYTSTMRFSAGVSGNTVLDYNIPSDPTFGKIALNLSDSNNTANYRKFLRGVIISSDW